MRWSTAGALAPAFHAAPFLLCRPQQPVKETAAFFVRNNFTLFFDIDSDGRYAQWLHSIVVFDENDANSKTPKDNVYGAMTGSAQPPKQVCRVARELRICAWNYLLCVHAAVHPHSRQRGVASAPLATRAPPA
jgi:hypothetical protein